MLTWDQKFYQGRVPKETRWSRRLLLRQKLPGRNWYIDYLQALLLLSVLTTRAVTKTKEERRGRGDGSSEEIWLSASLDIVRVIAIIMVIATTTIIAIILIICVIIIFASVGQHHHYYHRTLVSGRTIGKDITLVSRRAPPHTAKGKTKPLQNNLDDDKFLVDGVREPIKNVLAEFVR